jgi:hypothetical protein
MFSSSGPQSEVDMEEEMRMPYVVAFRTQVEEEMVSDEELMTAIQYLNTLKGGKSSLQPYSTSTPSREVNLAYNLTAPQHP